jgi:branched-chain amino acid transport system substrate-binding protein
MVFMKNKAASACALLALIGHLLPAAAAEPEGKTASRSAIRLGFIAPLTGAAAPGGEAMVNGIRLFLEENHYKMAGRVVELIIENDGSSPATGAAAATKLALEDKVNIMDGILLVNVAYATAPVADKFQIPLVGAVCTADDITQRKPLKWFVRTGYASSQPSHPFGEWVYKTLGYRRIVTFAMDYPFGYEVVGGFQRSFEAAGGKIVQKLWGPLGFTDFTSFMKDMRRDADAVFMCNVGNAAGIIPKEYKESGPGLPVIGSGTTADEATLAKAGDDAIGYITALIYCPSIETDANRKFVEAYENKYKKAPSYYAECGYTSGMWIKQAVESIQGDVENKEKLLAALKKVKLTDAPRGPVQLDDHNSAVENIYVRKVTKNHGEVENTVIETFKNVSQFWKWNPAEYMKDPLYTKDYPPCKYCAK